MNQQIYNMQDHGFILLDTEINLSGVIYISGSVWNGLLREYFIISQTDNSSDAITHMVEVLNTLLLEGAIRDIDSPFNWIESTPEYLWNERYSDSNNTLFNITIPQNYKVENPDWELPQGQTAVVLSDSIENLEITYTVV